MKTVLITGTTSGIGAAFAKIFAVRGYHVILVSRNEKKLRLQKKALSLPNNKIDYIVQDLRRPDAAANLYQVVSGRGYGVDVLINNAGFNEHGLFQYSNLKKEHGMIDLHIRFVTDMMKLFLPRMIKNKSGRIINVASTAGFIPSPCEAVYSATKAYLVHLSRAVNQDLKDTGVTVTALCPGATATEFSVKSHVENTILYRYLVMDADKTALCGYKAMKQGKDLAVPGVLPWIQITAGRLLPYPLLGPIAKFMWSKF